MPCCIIALLAFFGPRLILLGIWLFNNPYLQNAVSNFFLQCLGFIFLPWMLLAWVVVLATTGYVGLASVIAVALLVPLAWWMGGEPVRLGFASIVALLVLFTHRGNLQRLRAGSESRFERARLLRRR